ncbi:GYF domain-containing protein [Lentisphaerota bacterium WC36G]|nr:DUF4339 domain-containing protein [Lentisphaerae bacterium WC36]
MEYFLKGKSKEFGPYTKIKMLKMVDEGLITMNSKVRSQMLNDWKKASSFAFLKDAIKAKMSASGEEYVEENTAYQNKLIPLPAGGFLRTMAVISDIVFILLISTIFLWFTYIYASGIGASSTPTLKIYLEKNDLKIAEKIPAEMIKKNYITSSTRKPNKSDDKSAEFKRGAVWEYKKSSSESEKYIAISVFDGDARWAPIDKVNSLLTFFSCIIFSGYFIASLFLFGVRSQTIGMWFFGLTLVKYDEEETLEPITADIAFKYYMLSLGLGFTTLIVSLFEPKRRSLQEQLTDTWLIRVRSKVVD